MSRRADPTLIGAFVLGGVMLAVISVVVFGSGRLFRETREFISFFEGSVAGLDVGAPVKFRGIDIGQVTGVLIDIQAVQRDPSDVRIAVVYELDRQRLESRGANVRMSDPLNIDTLLYLGVRAELSTESLVTGRKFIALDLDPMNPVLARPVVGAPYPEIPAVNTGLGRIQEELQGIIADLGGVPLGELVTAATTALTDLGSLAANPELKLAIQALPATLENLSATVADMRLMMANVDASLEPMRNGVLATAEQTSATVLQLETTIRDLGQVFEPTSPASVRFDQAMLDLSAASRALRELTEYIERNPSALLRGRPGGER